MSTLLQKVNTSQELHAVASDLADAKDLSLTLPVLATITTVCPATGYIVGGGLFATGIGITYTVNR
ncbi:hypothetical protein YW3DRAFT_06488 [Streptomyces sp. MnatMP-M77]|uniref:hypothetical protein n=1 Tax=unclassified Streptomyces TaxID=2593676 RepID=UPI0008050828|nr:MULTISPECIES: hypothetical protein [unclassified Streptomyces]MYT77500.1 hypothetical protein [Streptomyces sp. SID8364]SBU99224.1 hypothetical protein YW3DRAFT_06488 [Streptomyces sp. MnatMP-M77]SCE22961.1 hypothetical protein GA0115261_1038411 [Streptomyces sp. OspMP-M43]